MNTTILLPEAFGPYCLKVLLSMFSSMIFWKSIEVVLEEKLMFKIWYLSTSRLLKPDYTVTVLAVPESPQNSAGFFSDIIWLSSQAYLTVSTVGTRIAENFLLGGGA